MKINDFIQNFANQFDETDASEFQATTEFRQLDEWSSLSSLAIISMIDDEYDVVINVQSPNQKIPDRKTKCVIKTHINIKQNVIFGAKLKPV